MPKNAAAATKFSIDLMTRTLPNDVVDAARFAMTDWFGVAIGAADQKQVQAFKRAVNKWQSTGNAHILLGGSANAAPAALVNGMMAHCLDFDDTHVRSIAHLSGPIVAASLAVGGETGARPDAILRAFIAGFEVGGRVGGGGFGVAINERHIHSTGVCGCIGAAVAAGLLYGLNGEQLQQAIGLAATQVAGLTGSFGTPAKPFHAGKAAINGVLAAQMAAEGFEGGLDLIEPDSGLDRALVQDQSVRMHDFDFEEGWEITRNTFKPYASCLLTHPVIDAGRRLAASVDLSVIREIKVRVHPLAIQLAGKPDPKTPFEGKFSLAFCAALSLAGRALTQLDFVSETIADEKYRALVQKVVLEPVPQMDKTAAEVEVLDGNGRCHSERTALALGNPGNPMSWDDLKRKFLSLAKPIIKDDAEKLFGLLARFDQLDHVSGVMELT
jgi:2-methylcitrate dehydratase PrpD